MLEESNPEAIAMAIQKNRNWVKSESTHSTARCEPQKLEMLSEPYHQRRRFNKSLDNSIFRFFFSFSFFSLSPRNFNCS